MLTEHNAFEYTYIDNQASKTLVLLHGTGGTKDDFLFLNNSLKHNYNLLGLQGNIRENGQARFFKRLAEGVFDQESITSESSKLTAFLQAWPSKNKINQDTLVFLGYSNGANMILATMLLFPETITTAILLHAMLPFSPEKITTELTHHTIYLTVGEHDPLISQAESMKLINLLRSCGAKLIVKHYNNGHQIGHEEIDDVITFLNSV